MKKIILLVIAILSVSCTTVKVPGYNSGVTVDLTEIEYSILGEVVLEGTQVRILGIISWGGATYYELLQEAKEKYNADDVINISLDQKNSAFLGLFSTQKYIIRGIAIRYEQ